MFYETSFGSTFRRRTQEFNSTGVFEMGSIETKPAGVTLVSNLKYKQDADINVNCSASRSTITADNNGLKLHQDGCIGNT